MLVPREEYLALIPNRCPAYISRDRHDANQRKLAENRARTESMGAPRKGPSLLAGLVICGRCGKRMAVHYSGRAKILRYTCPTGVTKAAGGVDMRWQVGSSINSLLIRSSLRCDPARWN